MTMRMTIDQQITKRNKTRTRLLGHTNPKTGELYTPKEAQQKADEMLREYQDKHGYPR